MYRTIRHIFFPLVALIASGCSSTLETAETQEELVLKDHVVLTTLDRCYPIEPMVFETTLSEPQYPLSEGDVIWHRLQQGLTLEFKDNRDVQAQLNWYVKHPGYMERVQKRATRYIYFILEELHKQDIPYDLALLPIVESAFEPFSYSHGQASGLWQFIPGTGKRFKLEQDWWIDERRDTVQSTVAAIKYLKYLHGFFDEDWELAIAAYNSGEGTVRKAIRKNRKRGLPTDFWHLDLPKETRAYVPKMVALVEMFRNPKKYNLTLLDIPNSPYFDYVTLDSQIDLAQAATLAGTTIEEIYYLNPGLNRWATPPSTSYNLKLPVNSIDEFTQGLDELPPSSRVTWKRYKVKSGDTLSTIASRHKTDTHSIKSINNLRGNTVYIGQALMIPVASQNHLNYKYSESTRLGTRQNIKPKNASVKHVHFVQPGDSFWKIAQQYDVSVKALAKWNNKAPKDTLSVGEKLVIWSSNVQSLGNRPAKVTKINYKVRRGDSLAKVASKFNIKVQEIINWNNINPKKYLQPGQPLTLFVNIMETY